MGFSDLSIGDMSKRTSCNIETIRYYERIGLTPAPHRQGRYRRYTEQDVARLIFIRRTRELGFTLDEVRALLDLAAAAPSSCKRARNLAAAHLSDVRARIVDLRRMERTLAKTVRQCDAATSARCPLIDALAK